MIHLLEKIKNKKTTIIGGIALFALILPNAAGAGLADWIAQSIITKLMEFVFSILGIFVRVGGGMFESMLNIGFEGNLSVVQAGWRVTRDFSNMFFIVFMVIIAFATILRFERYGIKNLLPKVIIIALLINFSFVLCAIVVDFSNIAAKFFINGINTDLGGEGRISSTFVDNLKLADAYLPVNCEAQRDKAQAICSTPTCAANAQAAYNSCIQSQQVQNTSSWGKVLSLLISLTIGSLLLLIAAFTLFAGAIMLLVRIVVIWFLLMFVPFIFLCYIMPALGRFWKQWWGSFLKWCFFAPAYAFFIWLAVKVAAENRNQQMAANIQSGVNEFINTGSGATALTSQAGSTLISYGFLIAILVGGIIAAQKFGIFGANATMNIVQKGYRGAKDWSKRTAMRPVKVTGTAIGAGALTAGGKLFGGKIGGRMKAKATELKMAAQERPEHKKFAKLLGAMSEADVLREMKTTGIRGFMATREAAKRGSLRDAEVSDVRIAMQKLKAFNEVEAYNKLKELRPAAIADATEQSQTVQKISQEGNLNKIAARDFKDERLVATITKFASAAQIESSAKQSPQHAENMKETLGILTKTGNAFQSAMSALEKDRIHFAFASQAGDISRMSDPQTRQWAQKAGPEGIKRLNITNPPASIHIVAEEIPGNQLAQVIEKISDVAVAKEMVRYLKNVSTGPNKNVVAKNPYLDSLST